MTYAYGSKGAPAVGGGAPGLPTRAAGRGEVMFSLPGTYEWEVPAGVFSIAAICIAGGASAFFSGQIGSSGGGGALAWENDIPVTPGQRVAIVVGAGGFPALISGAGNPGGDSYFKDLLTVAAGGGQVGNTTAGGLGGIVIAGKGGKGGDGATSGSTSLVNGSSGGSAGGYRGSGANGATATGTEASAVGNSGSTGSGGSGSVSLSGSQERVGGSGGTGPYGEGASGGPGQGGSTGVGGGLVNRDAGPGGIFGAGGSILRLGSASGSQQCGLPGCVRLVWGDGRYFPSTDVGLT